MLPKAFLFRRVPHASLVLGTCVTAVFVAGCSDAAPVEPPVDPGPVPAFIYVSNVSGVDLLYHWDTLGSARLAGSVAGDADPRVGAGKLVFTSVRDGTRDVYIAGIDGTGAQRLTNDALSESDPALSPDGSTVTYVRTQNGTTRLWTMHADGSNAAELATGSADYVFEGAPSWSPDGSQLAFTSLRTGTSQVFVLPTGGGPVAQVTHEPGGAFEPAWSPDGASIYYTSGGGVHTAVRRVIVATAEASDIARDSAGDSQPACDDAYCLVVVGDPGGRRIAAYPVAGGAAKMVATGSGDARRPAVLIP